MQPPDWNDLQTFLAIARAGQLARAAKTLGVDATTLGRRLRRLEARLGQTLFEQTREGQVPTAAGERLLATVELMQRAAARIEERGNKAEQLSGVLRVTMSEGLGTWVVARHLGEFVERHPALTVDLAATSGFLSLSKREADLAVMLGRPLAGPVLSSKLADYRLQLYASRDYLATHGMPADVVALAAHRLIGYVPDLLYAPELNYLDEIGPRLEPSVRSPSINAQHALIAAASGIGVLPCFIGMQDPSLVPVLPERSILRSFWLVTHKDTRQRQRVRVFRAWLADLVRRQRPVLMGE
jgi:DNA-binding transcriptional LysR family regulator